MTASGYLAAEIEQRAPSAPASRRAHAVAFLAQPEAGIERNLLIAAAAGVDLVGHRAGALLQLADDQRVHVFIGGAVEEARARRPRRGWRRRPRRSARALRRSGCRRVPARAQRPASRGYRRRCSRRSKSSDPEKRSKTSDGPVSNRPPQSFIRRSILRARRRRQQFHDSYHAILSQHHQQQRFLRVQPVFGLVEDHRLRGYSMTPSVTSSPRLAGRQCMKTASGRACAKSSSFT